MRFWNQHMPNLSPNMYISPADNKVRWNPFKLFCFPFFFYCRF